MIVVYKANAYATTYQIEYGQDIRIEPVWDELESNRAQAKKNT